MEFETMRAFYADKNIPRMLLTKTIAPLWPGFVWTPFSVASVRELPDPPLPGSHWLRVKNEKCGICASDMSLLFVRADPAVMPAALPETSRFWLGHETVGVVTEVGSDVTRFKVGGRVIMDRIFAESNCRTLGIEPPCRYCAEGNYHFCINKTEPGPVSVGGGFGDSYVAHETSVYPAPDFLTSDQAAQVEPISIGMNGVLRFPPRQGDKALVIGSGIIGLLTIMVLRAMFPEVEITAIARYPHQQVTAEKLGANHILTGREGYGAIARLTGGKFFSAPLNKGVVIGGFDMIYDCVADPRTTNDALRWARAGGTVMMIGGHFAPMPKVDLSPVWYHHVNLVGTYGHGMNERDGVRKHTYEWVYDNFKAGKFDVNDLITHRFPYKDYKEAIRVATAKGKEKAIKVMFEA
jgi:threonine dehydrogenase-like Zn-dependent dehydrogenase